MSLLPQADRCLESFVVVQNCWDLLKWKYKDTQNMNSHSRIITWWIWDYNFSEKTDLKRHFFRDEQPIQIQFCLVFVFKRVQRLNLSYTQYNQHDFSRSRSKIYIFRGSWTSVVIKTTPCNLSPFQRKTYKKRL